MSIIPSSEVDVIALSLSDDVWNSPTTNNDLRYYKTEDDNKTVNKNSSSDVAGSVLRHHSNDAQNQPQLLLRKDEDVIYQPKILNATPKATSSPSAATQQPPAQVVQISRQRSISNASVTSSTVATESDYNPFDSPFSNGGNAQREKLQKPHPYNNDEEEEDDENGTTPTLTPPASLKPLQPQQSESQQVHQQWSGEVPLMMAMTTSSTGNVVVPPMQMQSRTCNNASSSSHVPPQEINLPRDKKVACNADLLNRCKIYVRHLFHGITNAEIMDYFSNFGEIRDVQLRHPPSGPTATAYITFTNAVTAMEVMQATNKSDYFRKLAFEKGITHSVNHMPPLKVRMAELLEERASRLEMELGSGQPQQPRSSYQRGGQAPPPPPYTGPQFSTLHHHGNTNANPEKMHHPMSSTGCQIIYIQQATLPSGSSLSLPGCQSPVHTASASVAAPYMVVCPQASHHVQPPPVQQHQWNNYMPVASRSDPQQPPSAGGYKQFWPQNNASFTVSVQQQL